jgi:hypothetical protein
MHQGLGWTPDHGTALKLAFVLTLVSPARPLAWVPG